MAQDANRGDEGLDIGEYTIHLRHLMLPMGLCVDDVRMSGKSIVIRRDPFGVEASDEGLLKVHVSDASLAKFLDRQAPAGLKRFHVTTREGKLFVLAVKTVLVDLKVSAVCYLRIEERRRLNVHLESVDVAGAGIRNLLQTQLDKLNPVIDVSMFPLKSELDGVEVDHGGVSLTGRIIR